MSAAWRRMPAFKISQRPNVQVQIHVRTRRAAKFTAVYSSPLSWAKWKYNAGMAYYFIILMLSQPLK